MGVALQKNLSVRVACRLDWDIVNIAGGVRDQIAKFAGWQV